MRRLRLPTIHRTLRGAGVLVGGAALAAAVVLGMVNCTGPASSSGERAASPGRGSSAPRMTPANGGSVPADAACRVAAPTAHDFDVPPFAFDPQDQALTFVRAMADGDFKTAYEMLAPEDWPDWAFCYMSLEDFWHWGVMSVETFGYVGRESSVIVSVDPSAPPAFAPDEDVMGARIRVALPTDGGRPAPAAFVLVSLFRDGRIAGVTIDESMTQLGPIREYARPPYVDLEAFEEREVVLGASPWQLGATLTVPRGPGPFPAVVLVSGDGYADRDATSGPRKSLRDLAWGLGTQGVATLRYDKRALTHALAFARQPDFTLDDEVVDDTVAAVALLRQTPPIDPTRVYVLGLADGGFAAPRIAQRVPDLDGLIVITAPSGSFLSAAVRRAEDAAKLDGDVNELEQYQVNRARARAAALDTVAAGGTAAPNIEARPSYDRALAGYRPERVAQTLQTRLLILNGAFDASLVSADVHGWTQALQGRRDAAFRLYRDHGFQLYDFRDTSGPSLRRLLHVGNQPITDIDAWIQGGWPEVTCRDDQTWLAGCRGGPDAELPAIELPY